MADADAECLASETASASSASAGDEERVRRLFQACDQDGDGYIDSQDLLAVCRQLSLEDSLDELMLQLGADARGRISYGQFLSRRLALRPEIDALRHAGGPTAPRDSASDRSRSHGKPDSWEWDSGARDMSPVLRKYKEKHADEEWFKERLQRQLDEQAQRYEEQLTELHSVIAELTRKLHKQRSLAIAEEDEISESCTSAHDESVTCPLEVSELEPLENELSDADNKITLSESPVELPEPKLPSSQNGLTEPSPVSEGCEADALRREAADLRHRLASAERRIAQLTETNPAPPDPPTTTPKPVPKMAERVRLRTSADASSCVPAGQLAAGAADLPTAVAETLVGDVLQHEASEAEAEREAELRRCSAKLEHARAHNAVLQLTVEEARAHCERLALLCGKYESNAVALRLALGLSDRAIEVYDVLLALLETELALDGEDESSRVDRGAAESVARRLLAHLDAAGSGAPAASAPWDDRRLYEPDVNTDGGPWTAADELRLRDHVSRLKAERARVRGTCVVLESPQAPSLAQPPGTQMQPTQRRLDLETAVLVQELMGLREDRAELLARLLAAERELGGAQLRLRRADERRREQAHALRQLQRQLQRDAAGEQLARRSHDDHERGVELELAQALEREARLRLRLQDLGAALERATRGLDAAAAGNCVNGNIGTSASASSSPSGSMEKQPPVVDRRTHRHPKFRRAGADHQMQAMLDRNAVLARVHTATTPTPIISTSTLDTPPTNSSENSV